MCDSRTTSAPRTSSNSASSASHGDVDALATPKIAQLHCWSRTVPSLVDHRARQVALLVLDDRELADAVLERRVGGQPLAEAVLHLLGDEPAPGVEDLVDEGVAADHADRGEQTRGEPVVVRRERDLGVGRDVVQVARPADAVADGPAVDEPRRLERAELLEDPGPARAEARGKLFGGGCAVAAELHEDVPAERRGPGRDRSGRADRPGKGAL